MLVQIALMVFALCGLLVPRHRRRLREAQQGQMQNAADAAALEGLGKRDVGVRNPVTVQSVNDAFASDCLRRAAANRIVRWTFDDNFEPADGDPATSSAPGPILDLTEGATTLHALQTVSVPDLTSTNRTCSSISRTRCYGDMVSGRFCYTADPVPSEGEHSRSAGHRVHRAAARQRLYARNDFNPEPDVARASAWTQRMSGVDEPVPVPWPLPGTGSLAGVDDSAFLVRLRRSSDFQDLGRSDGDRTLAPADRRCR